MVKKGTYAAALALLLALIFSASLQDAESSGSLSGAVVSLLNGFFSSLGLKLELTEFFVRKAAHFVEYSALGALLCLNFGAWIKLDRVSLGWPLLAGLFTAVIDEFLQTLSPGRAGTVQDVILDFSGVLFGLFLLFWGRYIGFRLLNRRNSQRSGRI